jgi:hypothetical protein
MKIFKHLLLVALLTVTSANAKIQKQDIKTLANCVSAGATGATCLPDTSQIWDSFNSKQLSTSISDGSLSAPPIRSQVVVSTGNGQGSVNLGVRRFLNVDVNTGTAITYADSATNGGSFTVNETGLYAISYCDFSNAVARFIGITVNAAVLNDTSEDTTYANGNRGGAQTAGGASKACVSWTGLINQTDVVRAMGSLGNYTGASASTMFTITKIAK